MARRIRALEVDVATWQFWRRAWTWGDADTADGSVFVHLRGPDGAKVRALFHTQLARDSGSATQLCPITEEHLRDLARGFSPGLDAVKRSAGGPNGCARAGRELCTDGRWYVGTAPPDTGAPRYGGGASAVLEEALHLGSADWMQDWPLEVADRERVEEFRAYYDGAREPGVRFDVMQLLLFSYEHHPKTPALDAWFDQALRRDFALHGHTILYWACLDSNIDVFEFTSWMRQIWWQSLVPAALAR